MKKKAKKEIRKLEATICKLPNHPNSFVYVNLWHQIRLLYCQKQYGLACKMCRDILKSLE